MLSAQQLAITFNPGTPIENRALRGLSLDIPTGQFVTVIGSNGCLLYTSPSPRDVEESRMPSSA